MSYKHEVAENKRTSRKRTGTPGTVSWGTDTLVLGCGWFWFLMIYSEGGSDVVGVRTCKGEQQDGVGLLYCLWGSLSVLHCIICGHRRKTSWKLLETMKKNFGNRRMTTVKSPLYSLNGRCGNGGHWGIIVHFPAGHWGRWCGQKEPLNLPDWWQDTGTVEKLIQSTFNPLNSTQTPAPWFVLFRLHKIQLWALKVGLTGTLYSKKVKVRLCFCYHCPPVPGAKLWHVSGHSTRSTSRYSQGMWW